MKETDWFSEEELDFLREMMNIGTGNAAAALEQILQQRVEVLLPVVRILSAAKAVSGIGNPSLQVACAKMDMVGDVRGALFYIIDNQDKNQIILLAEHAAGLKKKHGSHDLSVIGEIGNILAGVYLTAIHDLCKLQIYHTVPVLAIDMLQAVLDESIAVAGREAQKVIFIENEFRIEGQGKDTIKTFLLLILLPQFTNVFLGAIKEAKRKYGME
jgi:chemotaxis protein CheC